MNDANDAKLMSPGGMFGFCKGADQTVVIHFSFTVLNEIYPYGKSFPLGQVIIS